MVRPNSVAVTVFLVIIASYADTSFAADPGPAAPLPVAPVSTSPIPKGLYFGSRVGITAPRNTSFAVSKGSLSFNTSYDVNSSKGAMLGYRLAPAFGSAVSPRIELEGGLATFSVEAHSVNGVSVESIDSFGSLNTTTGLANLYCDINLGQAFGIGGVFSALQPSSGPVSVLPM